MISVEEALNIIISGKINTQVTKVPISQANGKILQEDLIADNDFPPFHRVTMDGIAINYDSWKKGQKTFYIEDIQYAGNPQKKLNNLQSCLEVMTGAVLPQNTDTVIRYEDVTIDKQGEQNIATINLEELEQGKNVHTKGSDKKLGDLIVKKGVKISAAEVGVAATIGKSEIKVSENPRIAIIATGDELVDIDITPLPHQIRKSNIYTLQANLQKLGISPQLYHLIDNKEILLEKIRNILEDNEALILSGGVSMGKADYIPQVMEELGVKKLFHKIKQRPGKPFWFGKSEQGKVVFALPGNPVSTFMCFNKYVKPWLYKVLDQETPAKQYAVLAEPVSFKPELTFFLQVKLSYSDKGQVLAIPMKGKGSGDLANLTHADGFLELPPNITEFEVGGVYPLITFR